MVAEISQKRSLRTDASTSARLGRIRQQGTSPEREVRRILHRLGLRFRVNNRQLVGSPDIANRHRRWVVFVHGCFWHGHSGCPRATVPKRNRSFWVAKFERNKARDIRAIRALRRQGYKTAVIWECDVADRTKIIAKLSIFAVRVLGRRTVIIAHRPGRSRCRPRAGREALKIRHERRSPSPKGGARLGG